LQGKVGNIDMAHYMTVVQTVPTLQAKAGRPARAASGWQLVLAGLLGWWLAAPRASQHQRGL